MKSSRSAKVFLNCIKKCRGVIIVYCAMTIVFFAVFAVYKISLEPVIYASVILAFIGLAGFAVFFMADNQKAAKRERILNGIKTEWNNLPEPSTLEEKEYQEMIQILGRQADEVTSGFEREKKDMADYYTAWVHQIKTPIAVMRMQLAENDTEENHAIAAELFRIEQYVEMVLQYIRLNSETNDLVVKEYKVDDLVRECIRKYASQFIYRKLSLDYQKTDRIIVTDKKWFICMMEQIISNAIKYTPKGGISIYEEEGKLVIQDTGIGIAPEDLPRIFEKGYTGNNGRLDKRSSGLGLYLCKMAADKLGIAVKAESVSGEGSAFFLDLNQTKF